jgi:hypothetical protein
MEEIREFSEKKYKQDIIPIIKEKNGVLTPADIAIKTGYPIIHIKYVLNKLASQYLAEIIPTDNGDLLYKFNPSLKEVGKYNKIAKKILSMFLTSLVFLFKLLIMITLIGYMIFYVLVITALVIAITAKGDSDSDFGSDFLIGTVRVIFELILNSIFFFSIDPYEKYRNTQKKRPFYIRVFSFIFGDDKKEKPFNHDGNILKFVKNSKKITLAQAVNLTGLPESETRKYLVDMVIKYNGDIEVDDNGIINYTFEYLDFTGEDDKKFSYSWTRLKEIPKLNYNTSGENIMIIAFNFFNLSMSSLLMYMFFQAGGVIDSSSFLDGELFFLYLYPLVFSGLFFIIPAVRFFRLKSIIPKVELYNSLLNSLKLIFISKHNKDYIEVNQINKDVTQKLYSEFPSLFVHDFVNEKEVISIVNYKSDLNLASDELIS